MTLLRFSVIQFLSKLRLNTNSIIEYKRRVPSEETVELGSNPKLKRKFSNWFHSNGPHLLESFQHNLSFQISGQWLFLFKYISSVN